MLRNNREHLADAIARLPVFNYHDHAWSSFSRTHGQEFDLPYYLHRDYLAGDLAAAGLDLDPGTFEYLRDSRRPDGSEAAFRMLRPFLDDVRTTSYFRYLLRGMNDLFGVSESDVFSGAWREASARIRDYSRQNRGHGAALSARMGSVATVLDTTTVLDGRIEPAVALQIRAEGHRMLHVARLDMFIHERRGLAEALAEHQPTDFQDWLAVFDSAFHDKLAAGVVGFKSGLAYNRSIEYSDPTIDEVARIFKAGLITASPLEKTAYQDFMMNRLCRLCIEADVPLQIHTGIQSGIGNVLEDTRPTLLTGLFRRHADLRVDLFHGGYPWTIQAGLMAKYFPNVHIDGCWLHHISPSAYRAALTSWIETVPLNKIFAWGGDHFILEHSYASLALARDLIADVLADLVERDYFDLDQALVVARRILHDNGMTFWRVGLQST